MYHRWLKRGNAVFEGPSSPVIPDALISGQGRVESLDPNRQSFRPVGPTDWR